MDEVSQTSAGRDGAELVAVEAGWQRVYLSASQARSVDLEGGEEEISGRRRGEPKLEQLLDGLAGFAQEIAGRLRSTDASRVSVQFGCEVLVESGQFVAVIGKASATSMITVGLEWEKSAP
ncbi:CU044_2847 family protein [Streptomyces sp. NBC_01451]|uniref:CU044_2847 family protein n=1 Tax=Streptomyces sp. NBC_01451 TaxID=2903872 RepID=UPI002E3796E6|nr:CU044_2847 family protein [Streptomyces sp. NBC_01451]